MNCDERPARRNRSVISWRRDGTFFIPAPVIGQSRHILWARTVPRTGERRSDARGGGGLRMRRGGVNQRNSVGELSANSLLAETQWLWSNLFR
jgi:hypothetical protein